MSIQDNMANTPRHICSGSIIDEQWILTSAYCVTTIEFSEAFEAKVFVIAGKHNLAVTEDTEQVIPVQKYYKHEKWDNNE